MDPAPETLSPRRQQLAEATEAVQQQYRAVQRLKRRSMGSSALLFDPDLPQSDSDSDPDYDSDFIDLDSSFADADNELWVPANAHPQLAPENYRRHVEQQVMQIQNKSMLQRSGSVKSSLGRERSSSGQAAEADVRERSASAASSSANSVAASYVDTVDGLESGHDWGRKPSLRELTVQLESLSQMAGLDSEDPVSLARTLSTRSIGLSNVERKASMVNRRRSLLINEHSDESDDAEYIDMSVGTDNHYQHFQQQHQPRPDQLKPSSKLPPIPKSSNQAQPSHVYHQQQQQQIQQQLQRSNYSPQSRQRSNAYGQQRSPSSPQLNQRSPSSPQLTQRSPSSPQMGGMNVQQRSPSSSQLNGQHYHPQQQQYYHQQQYYYHQQQQQPQKHYPQQHYPQQQMHMPLQQQQHQHHSHHHSHKHRHPQQHRPRQHLQQQPLQSYPYQQQQQQQTQFAHQQMLQIQVPRQRQHRQRRPLSPQQLQLQQQQQKQQYYLQQQQQQQGLPQQQQYHQRQRSQNSPRHKPRKPSNEKSMLSVVHTETSSITSSIPSTNTPEAITGTSTATTTTSRDDDDEVDLESQAIYHKETRAKLEAAAAAAAAASAVTSTSASDKVDSLTTNLDHVNLQSEKQKDPITPTAGTSAIGLAKNITDYVPKDTTSPSKINKKKERKGSLTSFFKFKRSASKEVTPDTEDSNGVSQASLLQSGSTETNEATLHKDDLSGSNNTHNNLNGIRNTSGIKSLFTSKKKTVAESDANLKKKVSMDNLPQASHVKKTNIESNIEPKDTKPKITNIVANKPPLTIDTRATKPSKLNPSRDQDFQPFPLSPSANSPTSSQSDQEDNFHDAKEQQGTTPVEDKFDIDLADADVDADADADADAEGGGIPLHNVKSIHSQEGIVERALSPDFEEDHIGETDNNVQLTPETPIEKQPMDIDVDEGGEQHEEEEEPLPKHARKSGYEDDEIIITNTTVNTSYNDSSIIADQDVDTTEDEINKQLLRNALIETIKSQKITKPNQPLEMRDSAFGFPLPPVSYSTVLMIDHRLPVHVERAIYRLSHLKLADTKRPLRQQVLLSNFMYSYLNLVNHTLFLEKQQEALANVGNPGDVSVSSQ